jgi:hypothetical protein
MTLPHLYRQLFAPASDADGGGGSDAVDRGDTLPEDKEIEQKETADEDTPKKDVADSDEEEGGDEDEEDEDEKKSKKDSRIPLKRHKEILEKERAAREKERATRTELERKLAQYEKGKEVADINAEITGLEDEVLKLQTEYTKLLAEGELEKAAEKMAKIRSIDRSIIESKADMKIQAAEARNMERARYNIAMDRIEAAFPVLNEDHDDFDSELAAEVLDLKDAYQLKGLTPTQALQKAVKALVEPRTTKQEVATTSQPRVSDKDVAAERKTAAVKKVADLKQPPNLSNVGVDSNKLGGGKLDARAVMQMSQKEFAALNEETLAQMRGDTL